MLKRLFLKAFVMEKVIFFWKQGKSIRSLAKKYQYFANLLEH